MPYSWNPAKAASNLAKHGVAFETIEVFDWATALVRADTREVYDEVRLNALGAIGSRLHLVTFTVRRTIWLISLRKASKKEVLFYASES